MNMKKTAIVLGSLLIAILILITASSCAASAKDDATAPDHSDVPAVGQPDDPFVVPENTEKPEETEKPSDPTYEELERPEQNEGPDTPDPKPLPNPSAGLDLGLDQVTLEEEQSIRLAPFFIPVYEDDDTTLYFTSSDESIASVDAHGRVVALHYGVAVITVQNADGMFSVEVVVTVTEKPDPNAGITLDQSEITLEQGQAGRLHATFVPVFDADDLNLTFTSSDSYILIVQNDGSFTTDGYGIVTITVTNADGSFRAACTVTTDR